MMNSIKNAVLAQALTGSLIAVILTVGVLAILLTGNDVPVWYVATWGTSIGFYFREYSQPINK